MTSSLISIVSCSQPSLMHYFPYAKTHHMYLHWSTCHLTVQFSVSTVLSWERNGLSPPQIHFSKSFRLGFFSPFRSSNNSGMHSLTIRLKVALFNTTLCGLFHCLHTFRIFWKVFINLLSISHRWHVNKKLVSLIPCVTYSTENNSYFIVSTQWRFVNAYLNLKIIYVSICTEGNYWYLLNDWV